MMMLRFVIGTLLRLPRPTTMALLVVFSSCGLYTRLRGLRLMETFPTPFIPNPEELPLPNEMTTWLVFGPMESGVNVIVNVQLPAAATVLPQVFVCAKLDGLGPAIATLVMVSAVVPVFFKVTVLAALVNPACWPP